VKISLLIMSAPGENQSNQSALSFARAALDAGHEIYRLFFYEQGVNTGTSLAVVPQDEYDLRAKWQELIQQHDLDAVVCVASALKRGLLNEEEAERYERPAANLAKGFTISGLGQWVDACIHSDRLVSF
jgi:tRNA 2-thiouridine synthesizing protein D